jgi:hypothetical protein
MGLHYFFECSSKKDDTGTDKPSSQTEKNESALSHLVSGGKRRSEHKKPRVNETATIAQISPAMFVHRT